ncbi:hypothetical protein ACRAWD_06065 [Caulobacter segnis]
MLAQTVPPPVPAHSERRRKPATSTPTPSRWSRGVRTHVDLDLAAELQGSGKMKGKAALDIAAAPGPRTWCSTPKGLVHHHGAVIAAREAGPCPGPWARPTRS